MGIGTAVPGRRTLLPLAYGAPEDGRDFHERRRARRCTCLCRHCGDDGRGGDIGLCLDEQSFPFYSPWGGGPLQRFLRSVFDHCKDFYARFSTMLALYFSRHGRPRVLDPVGAPTPTPITSLKQLRDEIAYVIRNPFVVRKDVNLFAYPWCSGFLYFNPLLSMFEQRSAGTLTLRERRSLTHSRNLSLPAGLTLVGGRVFPGSFVNYRLVGGNGAPVQ